MKNSTLKAELTKLFGDQKENIEKAAGCLKVLAHPARLQIMCALRNGEQTVQDLEFLTGLRQTTLSQHLSLLKNRDVLASRREANFSFYRIANMRMVELFNLVQDIFCHMPKGSGNQATKSGFGNSLTGTPGPTPICCLIRKLWKESSLSP